MPTVEYQRQWRLKNPGKAAEYARKWWANHPEYRAKMKKLNSSRQKTESAKAYQRRYQREWLVEEKNKLFDLLGRKCLHCGFDKDTRALQFDHINGGGRKEKQSKRLGYLRWYMYWNSHPQEAKQTLQVLCANCNWIKRFERNETRLIREGLNTIE